MARAKSINADSSAASHSSGSASDDITENPTVSWDRSSSRETQSLYGRQVLSSAESRPTFSSEAVIAERYEIVRFIARGGTGEVYEAHDRLLDQPVALKTIRRSRASDHEVAERLKREIQLARQVAHPNICRLYELGVHVLPSGHQLLFLTMELLDGESLEERLRRSTMDTDELLPLARQVAGGLDAAHAVSVVHRDLKTSNIMLVPDSSPEAADGSQRAVITDFGLARTVEDLPGPQLTGKDLLVGTPAYMAPEQVSGKKVTGAADVYALGIVLYEALTGRLPFDGGNPLATAYQRLTQDASSPRLYRPNLEPGWEHAIMRALHREADKRWPSADAMVSHIEGAQTAADRRPTKWLVALAVLVLAAISTAVFLRPKPEPAPPEISESLVERRSVSVIGLRNLADDDADRSLGTALTEMLSIEAAAGDRLRVVPQDVVSQLRRDLDIDLDTELQAEDLYRFGERSDSDLGVTGTFILSGTAPRRDIRLDLVARSLDNGRVVARLKERGREDELLDMVEAAGRALRASLDLAVLTEQENAQTRASLPNDTRSAKLYAQGLELIRRHDAQAALDLLQEAVAADPGHPLLHSALGSAWSMLGYREVARREASRAFELSTNLPRRERLWVEARFLEADGRRREAVPLYDSLWSYFPDDLEYGMRLARSQSYTGQAQEALGTVAMLRRRSADDNPRLDLVEAEVHRALSDYRQQREFAVRAATNADAIGARVLVARAKEIEAGALRDLGEHESALEAYETASEIYRQEEIEGPRARLLIAIAKVRRHQGQLEVAGQLAQQALDIAESIGDMGTRRHALNTAAIIMREQGRLAESLRMHELEVEADRLTGGQRTTAVALTSLGVVERRLGLLDRAERHFKEALDLGREAGSQRSVSINLNLLGEIDLRRGNIEQARAKFEEALSTNSSTKDPRGRGYYLAALGEADHMSGKLQSALGKYDEALRVRQAIGETGNVAFSRLAIARLALDEERFSDAVEQASLAIETFSDQGQSDARARGLYLAAIGHEALGDIDEARRLAARASALSGRSENRETAMRVDLAAAWIDRHGASETVRRKAASVAQEARELGFLDLEIEADLLLATFDGDAERLATSRQRALDVGFVQLAKRFSRDL